jgi:hypothetical protein
MRTNPSETASNVHALAQESRTWILKTANVLEAPEIDRPENLELTARPWHLSGIKQNVLTSALVLSSSMSSCSVAGTGHQHADFGLYGKRLVLLKF